MTFFEEFRLCLFWRPRQALLALYWHLTRRRVRARNTLRRDAGLSPYAYRMWVNRIETPRVAALLASPPSRHGDAAPRISVVLVADDTLSPGQAASAIASVLDQTEAAWELFCPPPPPGRAPRPADPRIRLLPAGPDALATALREARGDWTLCLNAGDVLPRWALAQYLASAAAEPRAAILFGDQDHRDAAGRRELPWFKPQWNAEMILAQDYVSAACALRRALAWKALDALGDSPVTPYALLLAAADLCPTDPVHVPRIQLHAAPGTWSGGQARRLDVVRRHLGDRAAAVTPGPFGTLRIDWPLPPGTPRVTIIIPTRDRIGLVRTCLESVLGRTTYPHFDVIIVDNDSAAPETAAYFASLAGSDRVRVLPCPGPFNFAAINNAAAEAAEGEYLCFLNNDTEVIDGDWLTALLRQAARPQAGAAGAMLLYGDGSIQHAGVVIGLGRAAGHAHRHLRPEQPGYFAQAQIQRQVSAVTAACLLVSRAKFAAVGGFDADRFAVAYNDVDLCLKLQAAGWRNVYVPQARLYHHESKSRGNDLAPAQRDRYLAELAELQRRWNTIDGGDPLHHPDLDWRDETYAFTLED